MKNIVDSSRAKLDHNGIWCGLESLGDDVALSQEAWEHIYNYDEQLLANDRADFNENKLDDHLQWILPYFSRLDSNSVYLEIGSGPAHIGEYLMQNKNCHFVGVDFNYQILLTLKKRFDSLGLKKYTLIHADINTMPINPESIDAIYGGGVIEHFSDTQHIIDLSYALLRQNGVSFNTVPAFNFWWLTRPYNNIPSLPVLKYIFSWIHLNLFSGKILQKFYGYELSYVPGQLRKLHDLAGFSDIVVQPFSFHPSKKVISNTFLRNLYFSISGNLWTCPVYYVVGKKAEW